MSCHFQLIFSKLPTILAMALDGIIINALLFGVGLDFGISNLENVVRLKEAGREGDGNWRRRSMDLGNQNWAAVKYRRDQSGYRLPGNSNISSRYDQHCEIFRGTSD